MRIRDLIVEAPVGDFITHGDLDTRGSFRSDDLKKIKSPEWQGRVRKILDKAPCPINLIFVNGRPDGKIEMRGKHWIDRFKADDLSTFKNRVGLQSLAWGESILGPLPASAQSSVNVMLTFNEGSDRVGLTPWIVAHRIGHAFFERNDRYENEKLNSINELVLRQLNSAATTAVRALIRRGMLAVDSPIQDLARYLSPMRTARDGTLRDSGEWGIEIFAQFLTSGKVTFLRPISNEDDPQFNDALTRAEDEITRLYTLALMFGVGKFVVI